MNNNHDKKIKIPGILVVFLLVILGGFSGLTYAVASKVTVPKITLAQIGLSGLSDIFKNEIEIDNTIIEAEPDIIITETVSPTPSASPDKEIPAQVKSTPTPSPLPTASISPTASPSVTPTPAIKPNICSAVLTYRIGQIHSEFDQNKFNREKLEPIIQYAESQWESALGANIFKYDRRAQVASVINFTPDAPIVVGNYYAGQLSQSRRSAFDQNNILTEFEIDIFSGIFLFIEGNPIYEGQLTKDYSLKESLITRAVMHQMGHVLGLDYLPTGQTGIMAKNWILTAQKPTLSPDDIKMAKELCK